MIVFARFRSSVVLAACIAVPCACREEAPADAPTTPAPTVPATQDGGATSVPPGTATDPANGPAKLVGRVEDPENAKSGDTVRVREFHENGVLATERTELVTADGKRVRQGPMKVWHSNGEQSIEGGYDAQGKLTGHWRYFDEQGVLLREGDFHEGQREGDWSEYWPGTKQLMRQGLIHVGQYEGPWKYWHENGQPMGEGTFVNNKREGPWLYWHPDGTPDLEQTGEYKDHVRIK